MHSSPHSASPHLTTALTRSPSRLRSSCQPTLPAPGTSTQAAGAYAGQWLLFLDVDGVLNCLDTLTLRRGNPALIVTPDWPGPLARPLLARLKRVLDGTNALIVLSSTWREYALGLAALLHGFELIGIDHRRVVGSTPSLEGPRRAPEIMHWLEQYGPCAAWGAVDDIDLWSEVRFCMISHDLPRRG